LSASGTKITLRRIESVGEDEPLLPTTVFAHNRRDADYLPSQRLMTLPRWDGLLLDCRLATVRETGTAYGAIENAALGWKDETIQFAGPQSQLPGHPDALAARVESAANTWITPGLVDCHTHLVFAGTRAAEFELRLNGASYEEIARAGGGIVSTVNQTRAASDEDLLAQSLRRARALLADGATTIEIKSGYGLDLDSEIKMLRTARRIGDELGISVRTTFLGAHAVPPEFAGRQSDYVDEVCIRMLPAIANEGLADAVDAFCESIAFTPSETRRVFETARALGLPVKLHADQLSDSGAAALVAEFGGLSADHLEYTNEAGVQAMAAAGTVCGHAAGRILYFARNPAAATGSISRTRRAARGRDRRQSRHFAGAVATPGAEHGLHPVPHDAGRSVARRDRQRRARAWPERSRHARSRKTRRLRRLGYRSPGRAVLLDRRRAGAAHLRGAASGPDQ
jgi:imidazolonepropionase